MLTVNSTINLAGQAVPNIIPAVQGDTGRSIEFTLADFTIPAGSTATYYVQKPSGEAVYNAATIDGNKVTVELTAQALAETGDNYGQVRILNGEDVVTSFDFILLVKPFRGIEAIESTTEMNIFDQAVEQAIEYISTAIDPTLTIAGKAADAYSVGSNLRRHNSYDLLRDFATYTNRTGGGITYTWNDEHTVCTAVGTTTGLSIDNLYSGNVMPSGIEPGKTYRVMCNTTDINLMLEIIPYSGSTSLGSTFITEDVDYTVPESATKMIIRLRTRHTSGAPSTVNASISVAILNAMSNADLEKAVNTALSYRPLAYMQIFPKYTTIGDSLMGGYMNRDGVTINTATAREAGNNWVNYLALRIGRTFTNLAVGGSTTGDWRTTHLSGANIETNCYLVGLGVNDHRQSVTIGSVSDISSNFENNASTFYGNYDYIIRQLRAWNPAAHIFCFTIPTIEGGTSGSYNVAIRALCALYPDYAHCIDLANRDEYADSIITDNYTGGHFNPVAYSYMSEIIEKAINAFVNDNDALFATAPYV